MYKKIKPTTTTIRQYNTTVGETIEQKIQRIVNNKEPITDGAPLIYTDRKDGVQAQYDIRTDRWDIAIDAMDAVDRATKAQREQRLKDREKPKELTNGDKKEGEETSANTNDIKQN